MAQTHDGPFGLFWHTVQLENAPRFHKAPTREIEWPYRISQSLVIARKDGRGLVLGRWRRNKKEEHEALLDTLKGHYFGEIRDNESDRHGLRESLRGELSSP